MYIDRPLRDYLDDLAARSPAPGGGSVAALSAALGASLMSMVANYTIGNPKYKSQEKEAADILIRLEEYRNELEDLVDEDVDAYARLSKVIKGQSKDPAKLEAAYKEAVNPPHQICRIASRCLELCRRLAEIENKNLITDTAIAAILLEGAFFAAKFNVYINLKYIKDMDFIGRLHKELLPLEGKMPKLKEEILEQCEEVIAK